MLTYNQQGPVTFVWGQFLKPLIIKITLIENYRCKISLKSPGGQWVKISVTELFENCPIEIAATAPRDQWMKDWSMFYLFFPVSYYVGQLYDNRKKKAFFIMFWSLYCSQCSTPVDTPTFDIATPVFPFILPNKKPKSNDDSTKTSETQVGTYTKEVT